MNQLTNNCLQLKLTFKFLIFFLGLFIISSTLTAQKSIEDIAKMKENKWQKLVEGKYGYINLIPGFKTMIQENLLKEENVPNPKNIGILTFQLWDEPTWKSTRAGDWVYYEKNLLTEEGSNLVSNELYKLMLPAIKKKFSSAGITLKTTDEYLDSEEKMQIYREGASQVKVSGLVKFLTDGLHNRLQGENEGQGTVSADGYAFYPVTASVMASDFKAPGIVGKITENLGLDASLIISVNVSIEKGGKLLVFRGMGMAIVGPVKDEEDVEFRGKIGKKMVQYQRDGQALSSSYFTVDPIPLADMVKKTGEIEEWHTAGIDLVATRMVENMVFDLNKLANMDKSKK